MVLTQQNSLFFSKVLHIYSSYQYKKVLIKSFFSEMVDLKEKKQIKKIHAQIFSNC